MKGEQIELTFFQFHEKPFSIINKVVETTCLQLHKTDFHDYICYMPVTSTIVLVFLFFFLFLLMRVFGLFENDN